MLFNASDFAGDNFVIHAELVKVGDAGPSATQPSLSRDQSGVLTVWRKRTVKVYAMDRDNVPGGPSYYPLGNLAALQATLSKGFADVSQPDRNAYLDVLAQDAAGPDDKTLHTPFVADNMAETTLRNYLQDNTNYHDVDGGHPDNSYQLIGLNKLRIFGSPFIRGNSPAPHSAIAVGFITGEEANSLYGFRRGTVTLQAGWKLQIETRNLDGSSPKQKIIEFKNTGTFSIRDVRTQINDANKKEGDRVDADAGATDTAPPVGHGERLSIKTGSNRMISASDVVGTPGEALGILLNQWVDPNQFIASNIIHELTHNLLPYNGHAVDHLHDDHTPGSDCAGFNPGTVAYLCPGHVRELRMRVTRSWGIHRSDEDIHESATDNS